MCVRPKTLQYPYNDTAVVAVIVAVVAVAVVYTFVFKHYKLVTRLFAHVLYISISSRTSCCKYDHC